jgi:type II secretory pathway pseudopilin PulG
MIRSDRSHSSSPARRGDDERGAVLLVVLIMMIVGMILVGAALGFAGSSLGLSKTAVKRDQRAETAEGVVKMAIGTRKSFDPATGCAPSALYTVDPDAPRDDVTKVLLPPPPGKEPLYATVACARVVVDKKIANGTYGLMTTSLDPSITPIQSNEDLTISGNIFISAGRVDGSNVTSSHAVTLSNSTYGPGDSPNRYRKGGNAFGCDSAAIVNAVNDAADQAPESVNCETVRWLDRDGRYSAEYNTWWGYEITSLPPDERSGASFTSGGCTVYFPGRYHGLNITSGQHYFASGAYYFDAPVTISGGTVVGGAGPELGCSYDAEASLNAQAPISPHVSGKGVEFILGGPATVSITGNTTAVSLNRREPGALDFYSGQATSIVAANADTWTPLLEISEPWLAIDDPASTDLLYQGMHNHSIPNPPGPNLTYTPTSVPVGAEMVKIDVGGNSKVIIGGAVWVPSGKLFIRQNSSNASVRLGFGAVAHHVLFDIENEDKIYVGTPDKTVEITQFRFTATSGPTTATGTLEYNEFGDNSVSALDIGSK